MKEISKKNYILLALLVLITIVITLLCAKLYNKNNNVVSKFYEYSNKITIDDFEVYIIENRDAILYISDKNDLSNETFEEKLASKIDTLNLKDKIIFINKNEINSKFIKMLEKKYKTSIELDKYPIIISFIDNEIKNVSYINENSDVDLIIDYDEFE